MLRAAALALILLASLAAAQSDSPWLNWVAANSPYGFDLTPDGTIWINLAKVGQKDDYSIRAQDLQQARHSNDRNPKFWVRGEHKRNTAVKYRETKALLSIDCEHEILYRLQITYYKPDGSVLAQVGYASEGYIVPGTFGAEYYRLFCLVTDPGGTGK
jgi:hypothetical protein